MKNLISVNYKFMDIAPKELLHRILKSKSIQGIELGIDIYSGKQLKYLDDLVLEMKKTHLILQIHGNSHIDFDSQVKFLKKIEKYSEDLGYPIIVTLHSIYDIDQEMSLQKTREYLDNLLEQIDNNKLVICLENLNDLGEMKRLKTEDIQPIILKNKGLYFTYDIGHELVDNKDAKSLNKEMIQKIRNVHLHTCNQSGKDHLPIYKDCNNWPSVLKKIIFLINNQYSYNFVYEYNLHDCQGNTITEKMDDYIKSIDFATAQYL